MTYQQVLDFLYASLPMFQRIGDAAIKKDLTNIRLLCTMLDDPHLTFPSIHVAGTNGKGSTSHMLASIFQAAGKKVGLYTSPHYIDFRERIRINGQMISKKQVIRFVERYQLDWKPIQPSFFEITVAMAFDYFRQQRVDMAIIETGLGGRLDSTNIITPRMSIITNIGLDHTQMLGETLPLIASEKAGIIKPGIPAIIGEWHPQTASVFKRKAESCKAPIHFASRHITMSLEKSSLSIQRFSVGLRSGDWLDQISTDLSGPFQLQNVRTVLEAIWWWNHYYSGNPISDSSIRKGLAKVIPATGMIGRWMILQKHPMVITDAAHNKEGMAVMLPRLLALPAMKRHFVLGFVSDKDISGILSLFPREGFYYWCEPDIPRRRPAWETADQGKAAGLEGRIFKQVRKAFQDSLRAAAPGDLIFVGGSSYVVGDFLAFWRKKRK